MEYWARRLLAVVVGVGSAIALSSHTLAQTNIFAQTNTSVQANTPDSCPTELSPLVDQLVLALPAYTNRVIQRQSLNTRPEEGFELRSPRTYQLLAGQPQLAPLPNPSPDGAPLYQVFFTTLERQYLKQQSADIRSNLTEPQEFQQFHQLVLAQVPFPEQWRVIRLRSQLAPYPANNQRLTSPRNADQSPTAQAIRLWLRDCFRRNAPTRR